MAIDIVRYLSDANLSEAHVMSIDVAEAKAWNAKFRAGRGFKQAPMPLLGKPEDNVKTAKGEGTFTLSLAPADASGTFDVCRFATPQCRAACVLTTAGKGRLDTVQRGRAWKTDFLGEAPAHFLRLLVHELERIPEGSLVRLNTASDLPWERLVPWLFARFSGLRFYDYTKWTTRRGDVAMPDNYNLVFSISERQTLGQAVAMAKGGQAVAMVVNVKRGEAVPTTIDGVSVVDGDEDDNRYGDRDGVIVALRAKGDARKAPAGDVYFVKDVG